MFNASKAQADADTGKPAAGGAGAHARAGQAIRGNLYRGSGGQFQAGPGAQLQARVAAIRAKRLGKGKGKAKGKPKDARTPQEKANQNRAVVAEQTGMADLEGVMVRLGAGMDSDLEKESHDKLIAQGLAKRGADGSISLTPAGKKWRASADKGDADGARVALAEGKERAAAGAAKEKAKAERIAERIKQKAEKAKQKKAKAKPKKETKPASEKKKDPAANRAAVTDKMMANDAGLTKAGMDNLGALAGGDTIGASAADQLSEMGLVERDSEGKPRATAQGRALLRAADAGDYGMALETISRAKDAVAARKEKSKADTQRQTATKAQTQTGVMIALFVPNAVAQQLASIAGVTETASTMHVTLAYLGDTTDVQLAGRKDELSAVLSAWAVTQPAKLTGAINGVGRFLTVEDDGSNAVYVAPDVPGLIEFRQSLVAHLASAGFQYAQNHGYMPHITVAYVAATRSAPTIRFEPIPIAFTRVALAWGDERLICPLGGDA